MSLAFGLFSFSNQFIDARTYSDSFQFNLAALYIFIWYRRASTFYLSPRHERNKKYKLSIESRCSRARFLCFDLWTEMCVKWNENQMFRSSRIRSDWIEFGCCRCALVTTTATYKHSCCFIASFFHFRIYERVTSNRNKKNKYKKRNNGSSTTIENCVYVKPAVTFFSSSLEKPPIQRNYIYYMLLLLHLQTRIRKVMFRYSTEVDSTYVCLYMP